MFDHGNNVAHHNNQGFQNYNGANMGGQMQHTQLQGIHSVMNANNINAIDSDNLNMGLDQRRTYRKKKTWSLNLNITIETPELDHRLNESF